MKNYEITNIHEEIVKVLLNALKKNPKTAIMSYDELSTRIGRQVGPRNLAGYLGDISSWCSEIGAPMLSVMVINKNQNKPGNGFFKLYTDIYGKTVKKEEQDLIFIKELKAVQNYKKWNNLKFVLGI